MFEGYTEDDIYDMYDSRMNYKEISDITNLTELQVKNLIHTYKNNLEDASLHIGRLGDTVECEAFGYKCTGKVIKCLDNSVIIQLNEKNKVFDDNLNRTVINNRDYRVVL